MRRSTSRCVVAGLLVGCLTAATGAAAPQRRGEPRDLSPLRFEPRGVRLVCATDRAEALHRGLALLEPIGSGEPVSFLQFPRVLTPTWQGPLRFERFVVVGDHPTVQFRLWDSAATGGFRTETWTRIATETVAGKTVSVFSPWWPNSELARVLAVQRWGFDHPMLFWGWFVVPQPPPPAGIAPTVAPEPETLTVWLRIGSNNVPTARVTRVSDTLQYTSHIVNLVVPDYGRTRLARDTLDFDEMRVARRFYQIFEDSYEGLAIIPRDTHLGDFGAFHFNVKNQVRGIGKTNLDSTLFFGSAGVLQGMEVYPTMTFARNDTSSHELAHQWASNFDWTAIAGVRRAGHQPESHAPLWATGETLVGAVLEPTRRVAHAPQAPGLVGPPQWIIETTTAPIRFHPMTLYAMGVLPAVQVPPVTIFDEQGQFAEEETAEPDAGATVNGAFTTRTIDEVIAVHGPRVGPVPSVWDRATVVVSRDGLLTQQELDYYTFYAQRVEDPGRTGVISWDGFPSFDESTGRRLDLRTDVRPRLEGLLKIEQRMPVDFPQFARDDFRVVELDQPLASLHRIGEGRLLSGRVTATDRTDYDRILVRLWRHGGNGMDAVRFRGGVDRAGRFSVPIRFTPAQQGRYIIEIFLFFPNAGPQLPRARLSPVIVQ